MAEDKRYEITVVPKASYVADQSDPGKDKYVFSYTITIRNEGSVPARLLTRHWVITDANGKVQPTVDELANKKTFLEDNSQHPRKVVIS